MSSLTFFFAEHGQLLLRCKNYKSLTQQDKASNHWHTDELSYYLIAHRFRGVVHLRCRQMGRLEWPFPFPERMRRSILQIASKTHISSTIGLRWLIDEHNLKERRTVSLLSRCPGRRLMSLLSVHRSLAYLRTLDHSINDVRVETTLWSSSIALDHLVRMSLAFETRSSGRSRLSRWKLCLIKFRWQLVNDD